MGNACGRGRYAPRAGGGALPAGPAVADAGDEPVDPPNPGAGLDAAAPAAGPAAPAAPAILSIAPGKVVSESLAPAAANILVPGNVPAAPKEPHDNDDDDDDVSKRMCWRSTNGHCYEGGRKAKGKKNNKSTEHR